MHRPSPSTVALVVAGAAGSCVAGATTPFTPAADLVVAVCIGLAVVVVVAQASAPGSHRWRRLDGAEARTTLASAAPWLALVVVVLAWELFSFFAGPRAAHPTVSSMYDALARWRVTKAVAFFAWLALGWYLVRR